MIQIRVETIDGDVTYLPLLPCFVKAGGSFMAIDQDRIQQELFPEYRLFDLIMCFVEVSADGEVI